MRLREKIKEMKKKKGFFTNKKARKKTIFKIKARGGKREERNKNLKNFKNILNYFEIFLLPDRESC